MTLPEITQLEYRTTAAETAESSVMLNTIKFDFSSNETVLEDGKPVIIEGDAALKQYIEKIIRTEKYRFEIYRQMRV